MDIFYNKKPKEKVPVGRPPKYSAEFRRMIASKIVDEGMTYAQAAKMFDLSQGAIATAIKQYKAGTLGSSEHDKHAKKQLSPDSRICSLESQVKDLKTEIGELYLENLMLKKALSYSAQKRKDNSSVITSENLDQFKGDVK